jgi:hypothetical protein
MNEPVAYINVEERKLEWVSPIKWETPTVVKMDKVPLYTAPPQREWVGLTDDEINAAWDSNLSFARAIEAKLKEKNA